MSLREVRIAIMGTRSSRVAGVAAVAAIALVVGCSTQTDRVSSHTATISAAISPTAIPLGDGKVSTSSARRGYVYACTKASGGGGAESDGPWIHDKTWDATSKIAVQGSVSWSQATVKFSSKGSKRTIKGNALPRGAKTGTFPIASSDPAYQYDRNPNTIKAQTITLKVPTKPAFAKKRSCLPMGPIGFSTNGVPIFNALDAESRDAAAHELQDSCDGHPERTGEYHYHTVSPCLKDSSSGHSKLVGYALDGFGIYGRRGSNGKELSNADLDSCHGHTHSVTFSGRKQKIYHYHATLEYPYTLGCYRGTATDSGQANESPSGGGPPPGGPPPPA